MDGDEEKTVTCLAITGDRRTQRPSGCTGIFYQLFDWNNKRLVKNSKKNINLISSGTPKNSTSKRFGAHDKLPTPSASKFHLIAEENGGGFPSGKKNRMEIVPHKHEMRPPSLVAKLMGLDSIPTVKKDKPNRSLVSRGSPEMDEEVMDAHCREEGVIVGEGQLKNELRPQKQRKTGQLDIHGMSRFGQDALQLKNVLSRSRKHLGKQKGNGHLAKLQTPVKSPRVRSGKNAARLIDAATKILEPRLRASQSRTNAITYPEVMRVEMNQRSVREGLVVKALDESSHSMYHSQTVDSFEISTPCKNCGISNNDVERHQVAAEQPSPFQSEVNKYANSSPQKWPCRAMTVEDNDKPCDMDGNQPLFDVSQTQECRRTHNEFMRDKRSIDSHGHMEWHLLSTPQESEVQRQILSSNAFGLQQQKVNNMRFDRDNIPLRAMRSSLQCQRVTSAVNGITELREVSKSSQRVNGQCRQHLLKKVDNGWINQAEQGTSKSQHRTPERKRRIMNSTGKVENGPSSPGRPLDRPVINEFHGLPRCSSSTQSRPCSNSKFSFPETRKICRTEPSSFTFQSPIKCKSATPLSKDKIGSAAARVVIAKEKIVHPLHAQYEPVSPVTLLKQKLEELTFQEQRELGGGGASSKASKILQDVISALATEHHTSNDITDNKFSPKKKLYNHSVDASSDAVSHHHPTNSYTSTAEKAHKMTDEPSFTCYCDSDHLSPGSVLGTSFSNSSCVSSSLDDYSDVILQNGLMEYAHYTSPPSEPATQLKQVTSTDKRSTLDLFIKSTSMMLEELMQYGTKFTSNKLSHFKEVVLHAGLVLEIGTSNKSGRNEFLICHFFNHLENFANAVWLNSKDPLGFIESKDKTQLKGILLDSAVEYLDSRFGNSSNLKLNLRRILPLKLTAQQLILDLNNKITQWADLAGKAPDELIEWELSHSSGDWDGYEIEASCVCSELDEEMLKTLLDEIVMDLY